MIFRYLKFLAMPPTHNVKLCMYTVLVRSLNSKKSNRVKKSVGFSEYKTEPNWLHVSCVICYFLLLELHSLFSLHVDSIAFQNIIKCCFLSPSYED
jgi:hypothetical protein